MISEGTGVATAKKTLFWRQIESAMREALEKALSEGITDKDEIRKRIIKARDDEWYS